jgi:tetratricopeptide (TPR) repeat protein
MRNWLIPCFIAAALATFAPEVTAQEQTKVYSECSREPTDGDVAAAKGAFQAGQASFNEADYERAIVYWEDAFRRDCTAAPLLLNLSRAYELDGQKRQAVVALETYLERRPDAGNRDQITRRIEVLNRQIEDDEKAEAANRPEQAPEQTETPSTDPPPLQVTTDTEPKGVERPLGSYIVMGVGGALAVAGAVIFFPARSKVQEVEAICPDRVCPGTEAETEGLRAEGDSARSRQNLGGGLFIGGVLVAGAGVAWYFLGAKRKQSALLPVAPEVGPGYAGLNLSGSF